MEKEMKLKKLRTHKLEQREVPAMLTYQCSSGGFVKNSLGQCFLGSSNMGMMMGGANTAPLVKIDEYLGIKSAAIECDAMQVQECLDGPWGPHNADLLDGARMTPRETQLRVDGNFNPFMDFWTYGDVPALDQFYQCVTIDKAEIVPGMGQEYGYHFNIIAGDYDANEVVDFDANAQNVTCLPVGEGAEKCPCEPENHLCIEENPELCGGDPMSGGSCEDDCNQAFRECDADPFICNDELNHCLGACEPGTGSFMAWGSKNPYIINPA
jgi:hypothetical protein